MHFILICATLGKRVEELEKLLKSLKKQNYNDWELIIVHQGNENNSEIMNLCNDPNLIYMNSGKIGLSVGRNYALKYINNLTGSKDDIVIGYPDDDCMYDINTLTIVNTALRNYEGIVFQFGEELNIKEDIIYSNLPKVLIANTPSVGIFHRFVPNIYFDEFFGVGSKFPSAEDCDYVYRLSNKLKFAFSKSKIIYHHYFSKEYFNEQSYLKGIYGIGAFVGKMVFNKKDIFYLVFLDKFLIKQIAGIIIGSYKGRRFHFKSISTVFGGIKDYFSLLRSNKSLLGD